MHEIPEHYNFHSIKKYLVSYKQNKYPLDYTVLINYAQSFPDNISRTVRTIVDIALESDLNIKTISYFSIIIKSLYYENIRNHAISNAESKPTNK